MSSKLISTIDKRSKLYEALHDDLIPVPDGMMRVAGTVAVMDVLNNNKRFYTKPNYTRHIDSIQDMITEGLYGELEHPEGYNVNLNNVSHKVEKLWFDHNTNEVKTIMLLLDNEKGKNAQSIVKSGGTLKCSTRCEGSVVDGNRAVISRFHTIDLVGTPGFSQASLHLFESLGYSSSTDSNQILLNEDNGTIMYCSEIKSMLLENMNKKSNKMLLEALNMRTTVKPAEKSLFESIREKVRTNNL